MGINHETAEKQESSAAKVVAQQQATAFIAEAKAEAVAADRVETKAEATTADKAETKAEASAAERAETKAEATAAKAEKAEAKREASVARAEKAEAKREATAAKAEARREADVVAVNTVEEQLKTWSTQLDDLVASYLKTEAQPHDAYRVRIADLRTLHGVVQTKLNEFRNPPASMDSWKVFQATIVNDLATLEKGCKDLSH